MSLNFKVTHLRKSKVFHAGDTISGTVIATGPLHNGNTKVSIHFKGKSQTLIKISNGTTKTHYTDKVRFFTSSITLHTGPCHIDADTTTSWPFTFQLPLLTEPETGNPDITYSKKPLYAKAPHPLPPSISVSGTKRGAQYKAFIAYELRAELHRDAVFSRTLKKKGALPVTQRRPYGSDDPPDPRVLARSSTFSHASSRLLPDHGEQRRSLREWARDGLTSKAPAVAFGLTASSPQTFVEGQTIPLDLVLNVDAGKSSVTVAPRFRLLAAEYKFKAHTHVRAKGIMKRFDQILEPSHVVLERKTDFTSTNTLLDNGKALDLGALLNLRLYNTIPTFESYSICRNYAAKLKIKVECAGKTFDAEFKWKPVLVLPKAIEKMHGDKGDSDGELSRASSIGAMSFGEAVELGALIVETVTEAVSNLA